ncbi:MAG: FKBP-type peptidyl-prolyl cis-trans isomerase [Chitinophagaceae bacterium]
MQKRMLFLVVAAALFASCSDNHKKTKSGLVYKVVTEGKGPVAKKGQILKFNFRQKVRDSLLQETYGGVPAYAMVDSVGPVYNAAELFMTMKKGDSIMVVMVGDSVQKKFGLPPYMKREDKITLTFKVLDIFDNAEAATADRTTEYNKQKDIQAKSFDTYMANKKANLMKTPLGSYIDMKTVGDGPEADTGKLVSVRYRGKLIPSEKVFETNMEPGGPPPIEFVVGRSAVIRAWDEAFPMIKKGSKFVMYIPAELAYGEQPGPGGQPHQPLMFDIEIVDVKDAPKEEPQQPFIPERDLQNSDTTTRRR